MIKMSNFNIAKRGTQATGLGVMIGRYSPESQHGRPGRHPVNMGAFFSDTCMMILATTTIRNKNAKYGPGETIILHYTAILGATLLKRI